MIAKKLTNIAYNALLGLMLPFSAQIVTAEDLLPENNLYWVGYSNELSGHLPSWNTASNWTENILQGNAAASAPGAGTLTHFGSTRPASVPSFPFSTLVLFEFGSTEHGYGIEFIQTESFQLKEQNSGSTLQLGEGGIVNKGAGSQVFDIEVSFESNSVISNESAGAISFLRDVSSTDSANTLRVEISAGSLTFAGLDASNLGIAHTGGNLTFGEAVTIGTGDSLSVAGSGAINFDGGLTIETGGSFTWALDSSAEINASTLSLDPGFLTKLDLTGYSNLQELEGKQWVVFNLDSAVNPLPDNYQFSFVGTEIDGLTTDDFMWQFDSTDSGGGTITLVSLASIPEPSTIVLLGVAGAIGGVVARRRKKMAANNQAEEAVVA